MVQLCFQNQEGEEFLVDAKIGDSILEVAQKNDIPLAGPCGGALACGMCHVILEEKFFSLIPVASEEEEDLLGMLPGVEKFSRLGCQVKVTNEMNGMVIKIPG